MYFTNRYPKGDVQFSDLTTLLGVVGGGAVTALFGDAKTALFGAYGLGLGVGFFAYFLTLIVLVNLFRRGCSPSRGSWTVGASDSQIRGPRGARCCPYSRSRGTGRRG